MSGIVLRRGHSFKNYKEIFPPKELARYNIHNNTTGMKDSELIRKRQLLEEQMEAEHKEQAAAAALAKTRNSTSKMGALISATVSGLKNKLLFPLKRKNSQLARNPDKNGFLDYSQSPTEGGYNSRKYKKPTILSKKPKRATILSKKPKKAKKAKAKK